jgi:DNA-binding NarL/FixJ family response regulator
MALVFHHLGTVAQLRAEYERATRLFAAGAAIRAVTSGTNPLTLTGLADYERDITALRMSLGAEAFAAQWAAGQALTLEQAIAYALAGHALGPDGRHPAPMTVSSSLTLLPPASAPADLSPREVDVLQLLVQGLTYAQIADKLVISRRTVNRHLTAIYTKLNVSSRHAATRFALDHHLV